jgi:mannose-1-phosphate guanylyltransferase
VTVAVVLAGGVGTRLYPASTPTRPKQFLALGGDGERSLLARTVERADAVADRTVVLTRPAYADRIGEHVLGGGSEVEVLTEPAGRDTGPALVYAAHRLREAEALLCLPSDHHVGEGFAGVAARALRVARETGSLVTLGVRPTRAATGYGYLKPGTDHGDYREVAAFREKPDHGAAARFVEHGHFWNAGVFAWRPEALLAAARDSPLAELVAALEAGEVDAGFDAVEPVSVDEAVLERAEDVAMVEADVDWDDLGSWDALRRVSEADADGNVLAGSGGSLAVDAEDCTVAAGPDSHVTVAGLSGLTVAAYDGRVLVVPTREAQRVREVVERLREAGAYPPDPDPGVDDDSEGGE